MIISSGGPRDSEPGTLTRLFFDALSRHDKPDALQVKVNGVYQPISSRTLGERVRRVALGLQELGIQPGDRVGILSENRPEWAIADYACLTASLTDVPLYPNLPPDQACYILRDSGAVAVFVSDEKQAAKVAAARSSVPQLRHVITFASAPHEGADFTLAEVEARGAAVDDEARRARYREHALAVKPDDLATLIYTSGTTGRPKGVQRDVGGYAVALAASMEHIFQGAPGDTMFTASDVGWVVGHSYIIYAPLIAGLTTVMYEGTPIRPDGGVWWRLVEQYKINLMFTAPTAIRVLKKQDPALMEKYDLSSLRTLFLAGEPLDEPTAQWIQSALKKPVIDNYWQTETGWPMIAIPRGIEELPTKLGSPGVPSMGFDLKLRNEATGDTCAPGEKGVVTLSYPLPPGCMQTVWRDDKRFVDTYWKSVPDQMVYSTFDWGVQDEDGYVSILGRTDDVINVAGHRLGTREIEEALSAHPAVAEVAVVGIADSVKGQAAAAFVVLRDADRINAPGAREGMEAELCHAVDSQLGAIARPARVHFVTMLPKTRSGKLLRRAIAALAEGRDPGELPTIEDPSALMQVREALGN